MKSIHLIPPKLMRDFTKKPLWHVVRSDAFFAILISLCQATIQAQISSVVFEDDFSSNAIDPGTYERRSTSSCRVPGALIDGFNSTL